VQEGKDGSITQGELTRNDFSSSRHGNFSGTTLTHTGLFPAVDQLHDLLICFLCLYFNLLMYVFQVA
jgi:hypothetical protein